ncbi:MAG: hypothetical protein ABH884_00940 [Candidatus Komeilibacteria bacterium]
MKLRITNNLQYSWIRILQMAGYHQHQEGYVKRLSRDFYPRFHIYLQRENANELLFDLHLDQRAGVHEGVKAHANERDTEVVQAEVSRVQEFFTANYN